MSISQEFLDLCRAQLKLLVQGLGVSFGVVYLTTEGSFEDGSPMLTPVAAYPETVARKAARLLTTRITPPKTPPGDRGSTVAEQPQGNDSHQGSERQNPERQNPERQNPERHTLQESTLLRAIQQIDPSEGLVSIPDVLPDFLPNGPEEETTAIDDGAQPTQGEAVAYSPDADDPSSRDSGYTPSDDDFASPVEPSHQGQIVVPLTYNNLVLGVLVIARTNQTWTASEQRQIEQVARTLATACRLDRRARWVEQKLREQHLAYEAFHQQQDSMLDTLLHQLRNPLTAVQTFGKLLLRRVQPEDDNRSAAEGIVRESDRIRLLLEQFDQVMAPLPPTLPAADPITEVDYIISGAGETLDASVASVPSPATSAYVLTGGELELSPVNIRAVLNPLMAATVARAQERHIEIYHNDSEPSSPHEIWVIADTSALQEVLSNLLDNAVKYTPLGGYIEVRLGDGGNSGATETVVIADTGPGIPVEDQRHLFERHFRGVQAAGDIPGTGLGLAIAQELMQQMGGALEVYSPATTSQRLSQRYPNHAAGTAIVLQLPSSGAQV